MDLGGNTPYSADDPTRAVEDVGQLAHRICHIYHQFVNAKR